MMVSGVPTPKFLQISIALSINILVFDEEKKYWHIFDKNLNFEEANFTQSIFINLKQNNFEPIEAVKSDIVF